MLNPHATLSVERWLSLLGHWSYSSLCWACLLEFMWFLVGYWPWGPVWYVAGLHTHDLWGIPTGSSRMGWDRGSRVASHFRCNDWWWRVDWACAAWDVKLCDCLVALTIMIQMIQRQYIIRNFVSYTVDMVVICLYASFINVLKQYAFYIFMGHPYIYIYIYIYMWSRK